jgi:hypothetical protein
MPCEQQAATVTLKLALRREHTVRVKGSARLPVVNYIAFFLPENADAGRELKEGVPWPRQKLCLRVRIFLI